MLHKLPNGIHLDLSGVTRIEPVLKKVHPDTWAITGPHVRISLRGGDIEVIKDLPTNRAARELADELARIANIPNA